MNKFVLAIACICLAACGPNGRSGEGGGGGHGDGTGSGPLEEGNDTSPRILMLDFRSGWWAGSAADFHTTVLGPLSAFGNVAIEYHHLTVGSDVKWVYEPNRVGVGETVMMSETPSAADVIARFDRHTWNAYNQIWILSGSEQDVTDVRVTGDLFGTFIGQGGQSCNSLFIGAGDGFIDHGNAIAEALGIGKILSTELISPGFFFGTPFPTVDSRMMAGMQMDAHPLFDGVNVIADSLSSFFQHTHGDSLINNPRVKVIAHDSAGRPAIGEGEIILTSGDARPFVIDAGMQRFYAATVEPDTMVLLKNIEKYLATTGCNPILQ